MAWRSFYIKEKSLDLKDDDYEVRVLITWGFQSESHMMTLEALVRLIPKWLLDQCQRIGGIGLTETSCFSGY